MSNLKSVFKFYLQISLQTPRAIRRLRTSCEHPLKSTLSLCLNVSTSTLSGPSLVPVSKSSARIIPFVVLPVHIEKVLCDSKIDNLKSDASKIIEMVLVSSTRILVSFKLVSDFFSSPRSPTRASNPDEVVVYGAAVQDAIIYSPATPLRRLGIFFLT